MRRAAAEFGLTVAAPAAGFGILQQMRERYDSERPHAGFKHACRLPWMHTHFCVAWRLLCGRHFPATLPVLAVDELGAACGRDARNGR